MDVPYKFKETMENESDYDETDNFSEAFICCVCRDLLYKPVVLACGHVSCFWCVHKSMSAFHKSRCPICRHQYFHFPNICQTFHLLLLKMYPVAYKRRENQTLEEEKLEGSFSPQISSPACPLRPEETTVMPSDASLPNVLNGRKDSAATCVTHAEDRNSNEIHRNGTSKQVSVDDVLCGSCKRMLFRPVVLNCGHAFCICCVVFETDEMLKCEICQSRHPGGIPKVCLELDHFLEEQFPKDYGLRRDTLQMKQEQLSNVTPSTCASDAGKGSFHFSFSSEEDPVPWWKGSSNVHIRVGCDSCGMYPIIGDRYKCKDCVEKVGYDLCTDCYTTRSKLPGRFNQQHTSEHKFEIMKSNPMHNIMLRLLRRHVEEVRSGPDSNLPDSETNVLLVTADDMDQDAENVADASLSSSETQANEREN